MDGTMFKEMSTLMRTLAKPKIDMPGFIDHKPLDLIFSLISTMDLSGVADKYKHVIFSDDNTMCFIIYEGLITEKEHVYLTDIIMYHGVPTQIIVLDEDTLTKESDGAIAQIIVTAGDIVNFLKAQNIGMFYRNTKTMDLIFNEARIILAIDAILSTFADSDPLRDKMVEILNIDAAVNEPITRNDLDAYIKIIDDAGVETLLDNGVIAGVRIMPDEPDNEEKSKPEKQESQDNEENA